jgi:hypothetical protein
MLGIDHCLNWPLLNIIDPKIEPIATDTSLSHTHKLEKTKINDTIKCS